MGSRTTRGAASSAVIVFDAGDTGGEMGKLAAEFANKGFMCEPPGRSGDEGWWVKLSWGVGSGGDMRLSWRANWFLRSMWSMMAGRWTPEVMVLVMLVALMEEDGGGEEEVVDESARG